MARFGLDYPSLQTENRGLIYASNLRGTGRPVRLEERAGSTWIAQGVSGIMSVTGEPNQAPVKAGVPLTDLGAGLFALGGILAALYHRTATGDGQQIDTSLVEAGLALSVWEATEYFATGQPPRPLGSAHRLSAPYQALRCSDGYITIGAANDRLFARLCQLLGHTEWIDDPAYGSNADRVKNHDTLATRIETVTTRRRRGPLARAPRAQRNPVRAYQLLR